MDTAPLGSNDKTGDDRRITLVKFLIYGVCPMLVCENSVKFDERVLFYPNPQSIPMGISHA